MTPVGSWHFGHFAVTPSQAPSGDLAVDSRWQSQSQFGTTRRGHSSWFPKRQAVEVYGSISDNETAGTGVAARAKSP